MASMWCRRGAGELVGHMACLRMAGCLSCAAAFTAYKVDVLRVIHLGVAVDYYCYMLSPLLPWVQFQGGGLFAARL